MAEVESDGGSLSPSWSISDEFGYDDWPSPSNAEDLSREEDGKLGDGSSDYSQVDVEDLKPVADKEFTTAAGKEIEVPEKALEAAKDEFEMHPPEDTAANQTETGFKGFTTAEGEDIQKSLETTQKRLKFLINKNKSANQTESGVNGFTTAPGKEINVPEKALEEAETNTFDMHLPEDTSSNQTETGLTGFTTAAGKEVKISEKALEAANKKFEVDLHEDASANQTETDKLNGAEIPLKVSCTSNVFKFVKVSPLPTEVASEVDDLTKSLLEGITINDETLWDENEQPDENESPRMTRSAQKRRLLEQYPEPPELPPLPNPSKRGRVSKKFVVPRRKDSKPPN